MRGAIGGIRLREKHSLKLRMPRGCIPGDYSILEIIGRINSEFLSPDFGIRRGPPFLHAELHAHAIPQRTLGGLVLAAAPAARSALGIFRRKPFGVDRLGVSQRVHPADVQDRDGARLVLDRRTRRLFPFIERIFADAGYQGAKAAAAIAKTGSWKLEIVKRNEPHRFVVLPKRWIVERTLAWISHNRRLARDFERYARSAAAFVRLAMIRIMLKRLTRSAHCS
jgi:transposase